MRTCRPKESVPQRKVWRFCSSILSSWCTPPFCPRFHSLWKHHTLISAEFVSYKRGVFDIFSDSQKTVRVLPNHYSARCFYLTTSCGIMDTGTASAYGWLRQTNRRADRCVNGYLLLSARTSKTWNSGIPYTGCGKMTDNRINPIPFSFLFNTLVILLLLSYKLLFISEANQ